MAAYTGNTKCVNGVIFNVVTNQTVVGRTYSIEEAEYKANGREVYISTYIAPSSNVKNAVTEKRSM